MLAEQLELVVVYCFALSACFHLIIDQQLIDLPLALRATRIELLADLLVIPLAHFLELQLKSLIGQLLKFVVELEPNQLAQRQLIIMVDFALCLVEIVQQFTEAMQQSVRPWLPNYCFIELRLD